MTIPIDESFIAMWYFHPEPKLDWLGGLTRKEPSPQPVYSQMDTVMEMEFTYRFRYYKDNLTVAFESKDEKHWYTAQIKADTPRNAIEKLRQVVGIMSQGSEVTELIVDEKGTDGVFERFQKLPFMHMTQVKNGQA